MRLDPLGWPRGHPHERSKLLALIRPATDPLSRAEACAPDRRAGHLTCRRSKALRQSHPAPLRSMGSSLLSRRRAQPAGRYSCVPMFVSPLAIQFEGLDAVARSPFGLASRWLNAMVADTWRPSSGHCSVAEPNGSAPIARRPAKSIGRQLSAVLTS